MYYPSCSHFTHKRLKNFTTCFVVGNMVFSCYHPRCLWYLLSRVHSSLFSCFFFLIVFSFAMDAVIYKNKLVASLLFKDFVFIPLQKQTAWGVGGWTKCHRNNHWHQCAGTWTTSWCLEWWMCPWTIAVSLHIEHLLRWGNQTTNQGWVCFNRVCGGNLFNMNQKTDKSKKRWPE